MGMSEPSGAFWADVKAVYDSWPPDDEASAGRLADAWQLAVDTVTKAAEDTAAARDRAHGGWPDGTGTDFGRRVDEYLTKLTDLQAQAALLHTRADHYRQVLFSAKQNIHDNIEANKQLYALYDSPLLIEGPLLKAALVHAIAGHLRDMIMRKAAALQWDGAPPPPTEDEVLNPAQEAHEILDQLGMVPVLGEVADVANALAYALEGNYGDAALSLAGAIPYLGWGATGIKVARRLEAVANAAAKIPGAPPVGPDGRPDRTVEFAGESWIRVREADGTYTLYLNGENYPESAKHVQAAQELAGHPDTLTLDESPNKETNQQTRRDEALGNFRREYQEHFGKPFEPFRGPKGEALEDLDEYPPARMYEGGLRDKGTPDEEYASVRPIPSSDNRGSGSSWWGHGVKDLPDEARIRVVVVPDDTP